MTEYIAAFYCADNSKIQLIKTIRRITNLGLKESKDFVEQKLPITPCRFLLRLTELQLGRFFIGQEQDRSNGYMPSPVALEYFQRAQDPEYIDISNL